MIDSDLAQIRALIIGWRMDASLLKAHSSALYQLPRRGNDANCLECEAKARNKCADELEQLLSLLPVQP